MQLLDRLGQPVERAHDAVGARLGREQRRDRGEQTDRRDRELEDRKIQICQLGPLEQVGADLIVAEVE